jgi:TonB-dependent starch-binding outer membrane protein SusC
MRNHSFKATQYFLIFLFSLLFNQIMFGQRTIKGQVKDLNTSEPIIGANIVLKSQSDIGTVTDFDGNFVLEVANDATTLIVTYVGYETQEVDITTLNEVAVGLIEGELLDQVVVIGYGTVKKEDVTGSLTTVNSANFNKGAIANPQQLLAGKVAGVAITNAGDPGGGATIRIRGESSLKGSNDPLIVIDGVPLDNEQIAGGRNNLSVINPNDIESMTVLKDASATAIYGNRASAGVILITTKKGTNDGKIKVGYSGNVSVGKITKYVDVLNADEFKDLINTRFAKDSSTLKLLGISATDWQKEIYQDAVGMDHNLNLSGGLAGIPFRVSAGYTDMNGLLKTDNFKRYTGSLNLNPKYMDNRLQLNLGLKLMQSDNNFADRGAIGSALSFNPTLTPYSGNDSKFGGYTVALDKNGKPIAFAPANPLARINQVDDNSVVKRYIANATFDYRFKFLPELRANLNLALDNSKGEGNRFVDTTAAFEQFGTRNNYLQNKENSLLEFYLNYKKNISKNSFDVMTGYSWQRFGFESSGVSGAIKQRVENKYFDPRELFLLSLFGRANYDFNDKLYATFTYRADATSRFSPENRWGSFYGAALSYKIIENENNNFNALKLRLSWGGTGQQDVGGNYYAYLGTYESSQVGGKYLFGNQFYDILRPNGYDEGVTWETTTTYNMGTDISFVKNKLSGILDIYYRKTSDVLIDNVPLPAGTNLTNVLTTNIGEMQNQGVEFTLNATPIQSKSLDWEVNVNMAYNQNEIVKLRASEDPAFPGVLVGGIAGGVGSNIQVLSVGYNPYSFYVYKQLYDESGKILENKFEDLNKDSIINEKDKYRLNSRQPKFTFGVASSVTWMDFDFSFAGRANVGNYMYSNVETDMGWLKRTTNTNGVLVNVHSAAVDNNLENQSSATFSDHYVREASFFRMDHITLGYNFNTVLKKNIRLYATIQNAFLLTKYKGLDPEEFSGIDNNTYPRPRNFVLGVSANF